LQARGSHLASLGGQNVLDFGLKNELAVLIQEETPEKALK
jgi:hypothetical protein